jgi:hypothetical protein
MNEEKYTREDRTMLIEVRTKLNTLIDDVKELKNNLANRVTNLENCKVNDGDLKEVYSTRKPQWTEFDNRLRALEKWRGWILGCFATIGIVVTLVVFIYMRDITRLETQVEKCLNHTQQIIAK